MAVKKDMVTIPQPRPAGRITVIVSLVPVLNDYDVAARLQLDNYIIIYFEFMISLLHSHLCFVIHRPIGIQISHLVHNRARSWSAGARPRLRAASSLCCHFIPS